MKLITRFEAASRSTAELQGLYRDAFNVIASSACRSQLRSNALASLETIEAELASRRPGQ